MNGKELLFKIKNDVIRAKNNNVKAILVDDLLKYLDFVEKDSPGINYDHEMQKLLASFEHERNLEICKIENETRRFNSKMFQESQNILMKETITLGQNALKVALLINGGASVAILAFLGNILVKGIPINSYLIASLLSFSAGVLFSAVSAGATYLSQALYSSSYNDSINKLINDMNKGGKELQNTNECPEGKLDRRFGDIFRWVAILFTFMCYISFTLGIWFSYKGFVLFQITLL